MKNVKGVTSISLAAILLAVFLFPINSFAYDPVTCRDTTCRISAGDYVEVALTGTEDVQSWGFSASSQALEGMSVSRTGTFYWTPTHLQTGNITVDLRGSDADGVAVVSEQLTIEVLPNDSIDWNSFKFVTTNEFAPSRNADMDGSASGPYSLDKLGSVYCKDGVTLNETIYFRGGLHTTVMGDNPAAIFCSGQDLNNPLVLTPWGNEKPILSPKGTEAIKILGDFVTVDGFEVAGYNDQITLQEALAVWWDEDKPSTPEGHSIIAQGILAKGNGIVIKNNIVHSWPGNGIKVQGDLSSIINNIVFNSGYYSTRGVGGVMVEGLDDSAYPMPLDREFGTIVRNNVIFGNESRIISHVFSKGFSTLEIDEGSGINLQQNNGNYTRKYLVENNAILFNGKGPGLRAKEITFRNNTVVGNGFNLRIPSSAGVRVTKISTSGLAGIFNGDAGATAVLENNIISVPPKHEAIRIDADSRTLACANNTVKGFFAVNAKNPLFPDPDNPDPSIFCSNEENSFIINSPVENEANNDFRSVSGEGGASQAIVEAASARLAEIGFSLQPSGFDIMSIHAYDEYIMPMINTILSTTPSGDGGVELVYKDGAGDEVFGVDLSDENFEDLATVEKIEFNWLGTRPEYKPGSRFNASYYQVIKLAPDDLYAVTGSATPNNGGVIECSDISIRVTKTQRPLECNAIPNDGFFFSGWSGDCSGLSCSFDLVSSDIHVIATFAEIPSVTYTVTPSAGTGGSISPSSPQTVEEGATTSFTLTPSSGYQIDAVGGTCGGTLSGSTYTTAAVTQNCTVTASFAELPATTYTVTPSAGTGGSISPSSPQTVEEGATTSFTLTPSSGYQIDAVGGTCGGALSGSTYTTAAVTQNCTVTATFARLSDSDGDGVSDADDAFPDDPNESVDTDGDGVGNNADTDDDGDGYSDSQEVAAGTDPLNSESVPSPTNEGSGGLPSWLLFLATQPNGA